MNVRFPLSELHLCICNCRPIVIPLRFPPSELHLLPLHSTVPSVSYTTSIVVTVNHPNVVFTNLAPLGRVGHRVAMSVCLSGPPPIFLDRQKKYIYIKIIIYPPLGFYLFVAMVILSALFQRLSVSRTRDFFR